MPQLVQPRFGGRQTGQGLAEYALILVLVAVVVIVALQFLGNEVMTMISAVGTSV
jgi:Flp pilus assembly pilin Flp